MEIDDNNIAAESAVVQGGVFAVRATQHCVDEAFDFGGYFLWPDQPPPERIPKDGKAASP